MPTMPAIIQPYLRRAGQGRRADRLGASEDLPGRCLESYTDLPVAKALGGNRSVFPSFSVNFSRKNAFFRAF